MSRWRSATAAVAAVAALSSCGGAPSAVDDDLGLEVAADGAAVDIEFSDVSQGSPGSAADGPAARSTGTALVAHARVPAIGVYREPDGPVTGSFLNPTERGGPLVFQVIDARQADWLQVLVPVRPNGTTGWVKASDVELFSNPYRIEVRIAEFELVVYRDDQPIVVTQVGIGRGATPTPRGDFYIVELLQPSSPHGMYGPFAFGLSGFSDAIDRFNGGQAIIGIHGTNRPDLLGTHVSSGCVRIRNDVVEELAGMIPLGTPVSIS